MSKISSMIDSNSALDLISISMHFFASLLSVSRASLFSTERIARFVTTSCSVAVFFSIEYAFAAW